MNNQIIVAAGIIHHQDDILIVQRSLASSDLQSGLWEFPGGKVEHGENPSIALQREIREELDLEIYNLKVYDVTSAMFDKLHAVMILYSCMADTKQLTLHVGNNFLWIDKSELHNYKFAKLDIPVVERILSELS